MKLQNASGQTLFEVTIDGEGTLSDLIAPIYDATATYDVNDYVLYLNKLYKCTVIISSPEPWTPAHWQQTNVVEMLEDSVTSQLERAY